MKRKQGAAVLTDTKVLLAAPAAKLLNETFATKAPKGGVEVGVSTITVKLPKEEGQEVAPAGLI